MDKWLANFHLVKLKIRGLLEANLANKWNWRGCVFTNGQVDTVKAMIKVPWRKTTKLQHFNY